MFIPEMKTRVSSRALRRDTTAAYAAGVASGVALGRVIKAEQAMFARLAGWSIAGPDAAGWVTDFLNAAYFRRVRSQRDLNDLRLGFAIITTYWHRHERRRLHLADVVPFHRAFGRARFLERDRSKRGRLDHEQLVDGAARLFGDWFPEAYRDDARRGWGIAFPTTEDKASYRPESRLELAHVRELTPGVAPIEEQTWHTYAPVEVPSAERVIDALLRTETWPHYGTEIGRFTALRDSPLLGQTFEIEVAAGTSAGRPIFQRGYVTVTTLVTRADLPELSVYFEELEEGMTSQGNERALPPGAEPILGLDLTTHSGHFMGHGKNRLLLFSHDGRDYVRAAGTWDPMPWHVETAYRFAGREAQHAFWGQGAIESKSMLHQIARQVAQ